MRFLFVVPLGSSQWNEGQLMLYFGLMAIAGCILICNSRKK